MLPQIKKLTILFLIAALVSVPLGANALAGNYLDEDNNGEKMTADLCLVRPLGIASTVLGAAVFVVSLPFSILGGNVGEAGNKLVVDPAKFTFVRPIGDFSSIDHGLMPHNYK
jgi:hypothetical protein